MKAERSSNEKRPTGVTTWTGVAAGFATGCISGFLSRRAWNRRGKSPRESVMGGAVSAVTGGAPEEMNEMPPNTNLQDDEPVVDGSKA